MSDLEIIGGKGIALPDATSRSMLEPYGSSPICRRLSLAASSDTVLDLPDGIAGLKDTSSHLGVSNKTSSPTAPGLAIGEDNRALLDFAGSVNDL